jgi:hypothetical protein
MMATTMPSDSDYTFVDGLLKDRSAIKLLTGPYSGVIFSVNTVQFVELGDQLKLKYEISIVESTDRFKEAWLRNSSDFLTYAGDIIVYILSQPDKIIGNDGTTSTDSKQHS